MGSGQSTAKRSEFEQDLLIEIDQLYKVASTRSQLFYKKLVGSDNVKEYHIRKVCDYSFRIFVGVTITEELTTQVCMYSVADLVMQHNQCRSAQNY